MYKNKKVSAIILCAGKSTRFKSSTNKILHKINGEPLFTYTYKKFCNVSYIDEIIIVGDSELEKYSKNNYTKFVLGGSTRLLSSYNGINQSTGDIIIIHDGARANITCELIKKTIEECYINQCVCVGIKAVDTIKIVDDNNLVKSTIDRSHAYIIQTPQAFYKEILIDAYKKIDKQINYTDDASIVEKCGYNVKVIDGDVNNIKVTYIDDLKYLNVSE